MIDGSCRGEPPAPRDERRDGHDPGRQVDDQGEGVEHDKGLERVPGHQPQERDEPEHSDDQPADEAAHPEAVILPPAAGSRGRDGRIVRRPVSTWTWADGVAKMTWLSKSGFEAGPA